MWKMVQHLLKDADGRICFLKKLCCCSIKGVCSWNNKDGAAALGL